MLLPKISLEQAEALIERINAELRETAFDGLDPAYRITVSAGIVQHRPTEPVEHLIDRADRALYRAKQDGRNRTLRG
jgi:diguanylate cyclase